MKVTSFGKKVIVSGTWAFWTRMSRQILSFVRTIILARLLSPGDFGVFGIALLMLTMLDTFSQLGVYQALIHKKENIKPYLNVAWSMGIIRSIFIAAILFFSADYISLFFEMPRAEAILKVIGLAIVFQGLTNIAVVYFEKELEFGKYFVYQITGVVFDVVIAISAAVLFRNVWALVLGRLAGDIIRCIVSYIIDPYRPKFILDFSKAKELFRFGKWILGSSILTFLVLQGDDLFVGKMLGAASLGLYQMAYLISNLPVTEISHVISQVTFPAYSKLRDDISRLRDAYLRVFKLVTFLSFPTAGLVLVLAEDFTVSFLGVKWLSMVPAMKILAIYGLLRAIGATTGAMFWGVGKPRISTYIKSAQLILLAVLIYPFIKWKGIAGASLAVTAYALIFNCVAVDKVLKIIKFARREAIKMITPPLAGSFIAALIIFTVRPWLFISNELVSFFIYGIIYVTLYGIVIFVFERFFGYKIFKFIRDQLIVLFE